MRTSYRVEADLRLELGNASGPCGSGTSIDGVTGEDLDMQASDFGCILDGTKVNQFFIKNPLGHLDDAIAVAEGLLKKPMGKGFGYAGEVVKSPEIFGPGTNVLEAAFAVLNQIEGRLSNR